MEIGKISASVAFIFVFLVSSMASTMAEVYFSSLPWTLIVSASPKPGQVLKAGVDKITVTWGLNQSQPAGSDSAYKKVKVWLCYAPASQADRSWRKTVDDLKKDKTCQFAIADQPYTGAAAGNTSFVYAVRRDVPSATYFVRAYVVDSAGDEVAYGQTTDAKKTANLFDVAGFSGLHASIDIAAACFSAFSVLSLAFFFVTENRKAKK
ncbi:High-affinity nitrate transporter 3.1 [Apostasia shenzhenica]|uniref:High-affinity nitrate transporter n=1 Tax=Apostasia shenzhenica TaxID=1088818 RepID=A0A2I0BEF5_9ASPA|nr:High-affinity nitrate transporter 3.1 [Apostasia shenzhenica]